MEAALENTARGEPLRLLATPERARQLEQRFGRLPALETADNQLIARNLPQGAVHQGVAMRAGDQVIMPTTLHGLDDRKFDDPLRVDFSRPMPIHSTFGNGAHRCPGSLLARTELRIFLEEWLKRIPDFRIKDGRNVSRRCFSHEPRTVERMNIPAPSTSRPASAVKSRSPNLP